MMKSRDFIVLKMIEKIKALGPDKKVVKIINSKLNRVELSSNCAHLSNDS